MPSPKKNKRKPIPESAIRAGTPRPGNTPSPPTTPPTPGGVSPDTTSESTDGVSSMSVDSDSEDEAKAHAEAVARGKEAAIAERSGRNVDNAEALLALAEELEKEETNVLSETSHDVSSISSHETKHSPEKEPNSSSTEPSSSTDTDDVPHPRFRRQ